MRPPPEASAFALAQRNFDLIPAERRDAWFDAFRRARRASLPLPERVIVELANTCNLDCPMCRVGAHGVNLDRVMSLEDLERVATALFPTAREVRLNGLGESTLIPGFDRYLDVIGRHDVSLELITNGTGEVQIYNRLVGRGATLLYSWDAATPSRFEALRRGARWGAVEQTVRRVAEHAHGLRRAGLLHLLFTLQPVNRDDLPGVVALARELGVPSVLVNVAKLSDPSWARGLRQEIEAAFRAAQTQAEASGVRLFLPDQVAGVPLTGRGGMRTSAAGCDRPWKEVVIRWDLNVQVCNMFNPYTTGNLRLRPFPDIWEGAFAQAFRDNLNGPARHPYCEGCAYIGAVYARKTS